MTTPFTDHVHDAIVTNRSRRAVHAARSDGRSLRVSRRLIALEYAILPLARRFDRWGQREPLSEAFAPMDGAPAASTPPRWRSRGSIRAWWDVACVALDVQRRCAVPLLRGDHEHVERRCAAALGRVDALEARHEVHLAMTRHLLESAARGASLRWSRPWFGSLFVGVQLAGLWLAPGLDRAAWAAHAEGGGILVNDLPCCYPR